MNILLWILQSVLALHTAMGAVWKFSHSERSVPSLNAIPHKIWLGLSVFELLCSVALVLPAVMTSAAVLAPIAATCIGATMLIFSAIHLRTRDAKYGPMIYWLVVAAFCAFIAYGRFILIP